MSLKQIFELVALGKKMRAAQIAYEEKRDYGSWTTRPLQAKAEKLEAEFDEKLSKYSD